MTDRDALHDALTHLETRRGRLDAYRKAWTGEAPAAYLSTESRDALDKRLTRLGVNYPRLVVSSLVDRMRVSGFRRDGSQDTDAETWTLYRRAGLVSGSELVHTDRALYGCAYVTVWGHARDPRRPVAMLDNPRTLHAETDPATGEVLRAVRAWRSGGRSHAVMLTPETMTRYRAESADISPALGWEQHGPTAENPWGEVPVVPFIRRGSTDDDDGTSAVADVLDLSAATAKVLQDAMVTSEWHARPRRWATGLEIREDEDGNPVDPFGDARLLQSEDPETRFGQLDPVRLDGYADLLAVLTQQVGALTGLPPHYLGLHGDQPANADGTRAAETQLVSRAYSEMRQSTAPWGRVAGWLRAVSGGLPTIPDDSLPTWANPETRTPAQAADAAMKLHTIGVPLGPLLREPLGYEPHEVTAILSEQRTDAITRAGVNLGNLGTVR